MQVLSKPFEAIPFIPFEAIHFKSHINIYVHGKNGGHVNDLGSKSCCHQSIKILTCPHDKVRITHWITTKLCRYLFLMNWLILLEFCRFFFPNLFLKILVLFFFSWSKHSIGHIWGMVGMIDMKWIASWCIKIQGAGPTVTLTYDLNHGFSKSKFEIAVPQECEGQLTLNDLGIWVGKMLDPLCDLELWPWPWNFQGHILK